MNVAEAREARRLARIGEFYLQEAILTVLDAAPEGLRLGRICEALDLPKQGYSATVTGQLHRLRDTDKVYQPHGPYTEWALTEKEAESRSV